MLAGQQSTWPKILFIKNRMKLEKLIEQGLSLGPKEGLDLGDRFGTYVQPLSSRSHDGAEDSSAFEIASKSLKRPSRRSSLLEEVRRQSGVFFDDVTTEGDETESDAEAVLIDGKES